MTAKTMDIYGSGVIHKPVVVDLTVKDIKVTGTATSKSGLTVEQVKNMAVADALKKAVADVLIEPKFETESYAGKITATVTGFPGYYSNFRPIKAEDIPLLEAGLLQTAKVYEPSNLVQKKQKDLNRK